MNSKSKRIARESSVFLESTIEDVLSSKIPEVKEKIIEGFRGLEKYTQGTDSRIKIEDFIPEITERLNKFEFVVATDTGGISFRVPSAEDINFNNMEFVEMLLNGIVGLYAELNTVELLKLYGQEALSLYKPINFFNQANDFLYIEHVTDEFTYLERSVLNYNVPRLPFSNVGPLAKEVFGGATKLVENNIKDWLKSTVGSCSKTIQQVYKGI